MPAAVGAALRCMGLSEFGLLISIMFCDLILLMVMMCYKVRLLKSGLCYGLVLLFDYVIDFVWLWRYVDSNQ